MAVETGDGIVVVDCGVMFPSDRCLGPELILPDLRYYRQNAERIKAVVVTHGHEDHVGAVPLAFGDTGIPVYAPAFAAGLIKERSLEYTPKPKLDVRVVKAGDTVRAAGIDIELVRVTHSIPDALALALRTPAGLVVHTGDFRIDYNPSIGKAFDTDTFARLGDEGVLLLMSDSTNVERGGRTDSEKWVANNIEELIAGHSGRVLISMFSSNIERVTLLHRLARRTGRKLCLVGRSLTMYTRIALECGYTPCDPNALVDPEVADTVDPRSLLVLVAGSQGEPRSSLTRLANGEHPDLKIKEGDMVIYSSRMIPGNEKDILTVSNNLVRLGATVYHDGNASVHTSGHAQADELKEMLELVRPTYFVPVHGEYRFLKAHADLAVKAVGAVPVLADEGTILSVSPGGVAVAGTMDVEEYFVEGPLVGNAEALKLKERRTLLYNGLVVVRCRLRRRGVDVDPDIALYGVPDPDGTLVPAILSTLELAFGDRAVVPTAEEIAEEVRVLVRRVVKKRQARKPLVHTVVC
jgi:ribonuclease J